MFSENFSVFPIPLPGCLIELYRFVQKFYQEVGYGDPDFLFLEFDF